MSLAMTKTEREAFLAGLHVGVVSVNRADEGPLLAPIWYIYEDDIVWFSTGAKSVKGLLMNLGTRISMVVQTEVAPYQYVCVEGRIIARETANIDRDVRPMAIRYLGEEVGTTYADNSTSGGNVLIKMRPEKWLTVDYNKQFETN